jgi:hypothetical protein
MRAWYAKHSLEERRAMVAQRDSERLRAADRKRNMQPHRVAARKAYRHTPKGKRVAIEAQRRHRLANPEKDRAWKLVTKALRRGELVRPGVCEMADGACHGPIDAHHEDYDKPLEIKWICRRHHPVRVLT